MSILLSIVVLVTTGVAYGQQEGSFIELGALDPNHHVRIGKIFNSELECIQKFDSLVKSGWAEELNRFSTKDVGNLSELQWEDKESNLTKYNTLEDQWLMEEGSPTNRIEQCLFNIVTDIGVQDLMRQGQELDCLATLISTHAEQERHYYQSYEALLNDSSKEQLPFRKFINFPEVVDLIFQGREPETWTSLEKLLYAHTASYVHNDADKLRRNYIANQNCDWVNAKALNDAIDERARLQEFVSQVRHSVNKQLGSLLVKKWNFNVTLTGDRYDLWMKSRQNMISQLEREVEILRNDAKNAKSLCLYADELAANFTKVQSKILLPTMEEYSVHLEASDVASKASAIEGALKERGHPQYELVKAIAEKQDEGTRCLSATIHLVEHHRRFEVASGFVDEKFEYPELFCQNNIENPGLVRFTLCNCIGSFCVSHSLAALFDEEYVLVKGSNGLYKIVRSGIMSKRKVHHCHTLANANIKN